MTEARIRLSLMSSFKSQAFGNFPKAPSNPSFVLALTSTRSRLPFHQAAARRPPLPVASYVEKPATLSASTVGTVTQSRTSPTASSSGSIRRQGAALTRREASLHQLEHQGCLSPLHPQGRSFALLLLLRECRAPRALLVLPLATQAWMNSTAPACLQFSNTRTSGFPLHTALRLTQLLTCTVTYLTIFSIRTALQPSAPPSKSTI